MLALTSTDVDKTGESYYGEQALHFLSVKGDGNMMQLGEWAAQLDRGLETYSVLASVLPPPPLPSLHSDKKGPVYAVAWSPAADEFCVVYGCIHGNTP